MQITFLGTGSGTPSRSRNVSAFVLHLPERGEQWLFDCGEGTQQQILRAPQISLSRISRIFISHLHGDHLYGLPGLLASRALAQNGDGTGIITVYGTTGIDAYLRESLGAGGSRVAYPMNVVTVGEGCLFEDDDFQITASPVRHRIPAFAFSVREKERPGRFDVEQARALGIKPGPLYGILKAGGTVTLDDGRIIDGSRLVGQPRPGRKMVYSGDTGYAPELIELAHDADLLIHEATYANGEIALAERSGHATASLAAEIAVRADVRSLILTHFSARYEAHPSGLEILRNEAQTIFPQTRLAHDFLHIEIPRRAN